MPTTMRPASAAARTTATTSATTRPTMIARINHRLSGAKCYLLRTETPDLIVPVVAVDSVTVRCTHCDSATCEHADYVADWERAGVPA